MQTRRDLYQAHRLMMQRVGLALLAGEPDQPESPMRRLSVATFASVMVGVLVVAVFGVWGLLRPGGAAGLAEAGTLIIEKETGTKYAFSADKKKLIPFLNYTSARLAMDGEVQPRTVSRKSLSQYDRGPVVGIPGAPDTLPDPDRMARAPWSVCVRNTETQRGGTTLAVSLVGGREVGGKPLGENDAVLVKSEDRIWMVWRNQRMEMTRAGVDALGPNQPVKVSPIWINSLPAGPNFDAPEIPGLGRSVSGPAGNARVGQVYQVPATAGGSNQYYVQMDDGLAPISETEATLLLREPAVKEQAYQGNIANLLTIDGAAQAAAGRSQAGLHDPKLPATFPTAVPYDPSSPLCAVYRETDQLSTEAQLTIGGSLPNLGTSGVNPEAAGAGAGATVGLDQVLLGGGSLVGPLSTPGQPPQSFFLLTDQGQRFPIPNADDVTKLGYDVKQAAPVPANILDHIPQGATLNQMAALTPVPVTSNVSSGGS